MKLALPRLRLLPRHVVFVAQDGTHRYFRIGTRWDGSLRLRKRSAAPRRRRSLLVVDAAIPLRRLFRIPTRHRGTRNLLLATAADAFPFDVDEGLFALGERDARSYIFALERVKYDALAQGIPTPGAVLVAASETPERILAAVSAWLRDGAVRDMLGGPRVLKPSTLLLAGQALILLALAGVMLETYTTRNQLRVQKQQELLQRTREEAEPLLQKRRSVFRMVETDRALTDLQQLPSASMATRLGSIIGALPEGSRIDRIQLLDQQLVISGWGQDPKLWIGDVEGASFETKAYPKEDRFKVNLKLGR